jgi:hypothetical protein
MPGVDALVVVRARLTEPPWRGFVMWHRGDGCAESGKPA